MLLKRLGPVAAIAAVSLGTVLWFGYTSASVPGEPETSAVARQRPATSPSPPQERPCDGPDAEACLANLEDAILRNEAAKHEVLSSPLVRLVEASEQAERRGSRITAVESTLLPKSLADLVATRRMRLDEAGRVQVFIETSGPPSAVVTHLKAVGVDIERVSDEYGIVQAWVPVGRLAAAAATPGVGQVRLPDYGFAQTGSVTTEGDWLLDADEARSQFGVDGSGLRVGVISDGVAGLADSQGSGDLPSVNTATCNVVPQSPTQLDAGAEGTAMLEIVHDIAPGAELWFGHWGAWFGGTMLDFMDAVNCLAVNVDVIVDDIAFFNAGSYDGTSPVSVNAAFALHVPGNRVRAYYNAVGNFALEHYQQRYRDGSTLNPALAGMHVFAPSATTVDVYGIGPYVADPLYLSHDGLICVALQWNDPFSGSSNDYDLLLFDEDLLVGGHPDPVVAESVGPQTGTQAPVEELCYQNAGSEGWFDIVIIRYDAPRARTFDMFILCLGCPGLPAGEWYQPIHNYNTRCSSVPNNSDAGYGVVSLGAIDAGDPGLNDIEPYSSCGPTNDGRLKPEAVTVDGVSVTANGGFFTPFHGTSAAGPHAAGIATLLLDCNPTLVRDDLRFLLLATAVDLGAAGPDSIFGTGRLDALAAVGAVPCVGPPTPTPTPTAPPTPTPTPTPKDPSGDTDGDTILNGDDPDDDNDGCTDAQELGGDPSLGGQRNPHNFWDLFAVPAGVGLVRDADITGQDIFAVIGRFNATDTGPGDFDRNSDPLSTPNPYVPGEDRANYHPAYDRGPLVGPHAWDLGPADGAVTGAEIFAVIAQFGHSCT